MEKIIATYIFRFPRPKVEGGDMPKQVTQDRASLTRPILG